MNTPHFSYKNNPTSIMRAGKNYPISSHVFFSHVRTSQGCENVKIQMTRCDLCSLSDVEKKPSAGENVQFTAVKLLNHTEMSVCVSLTKIAVHVVSIHRQ
uniref:Uncharacterized protein n=1 Tax=Anguilla anguilla TaxID=7936 RepID=A0A0E9XUI5_ANGAN